jgi:hypothetical protein
LLSAITTENNQDCTAPLSATAPSFMRVLLLAAVVLSLGTGNATSPKSKRMTKIWRDPQYLPFVAHDTGTGNGPFEKWLVSEVFVLEMYVSILSCCARARAKLLKTVCQEELEQVSRLFAVRLRGM